MVDQLASAREAVKRASDVTDNATIQEQLRSIDEGLMEMTESEEDTDEASTVGDEPRGDDLEEVEAKLATLAGEADDAASGHITDARDAIDAYRRAFTRDW